MTSEWKILLTEIPIYRFKSHLGRNSTPKLTCQMITAFKIRYKSCELKCYFKKMFTPLVKND